MEQIKLRQSYLEEFKPLTVIPQRGSHKNHDPIVTFTEYTGKVDEIIRLNNNEALGRVKVVRDVNNGRLRPLGNYPSCRVWNNFFIYS